VAIAMVLKRSGKPWFVCMVILFDDVPLVEFMMNSTFPDY